MFIIQTVWSGGATAAHKTFNLGVEGSIPSRFTICPHDGTADIGDLKSPALERAGSNPAEDTNIAP